VPLDDFRVPGNGRAEFVLSNLYVYFWRWGTWKVFESTAAPDREFVDTGIVNYITAMGYVTGPSFKGMREYMRRKALHGWIINLTPEGKQPPARNAVFNIETPVGIGIFARTPDADESIPADIRYLELHGTREEKFASLEKLTLEDERWRPARTDWQAPFTPAARTNWDTFPAVGDLLPWRSTGVTPNRNWVIAPDQGTLFLRLQTLLRESDPKEK
jgi:predicted helicase